MNNININNDTNNTTFKSQTSLDVFEHLFDQYFFYLIIIILYIFAYYSYSLLCN